MTQPQQSTLARKWVLDVNTGTVGVPAWTTVKGVSNFTPVRAEATLEDDNVYEDAGYLGQTKTALAWHAEVELKRRTLPSDVTTYDPGQEKLRILAQTLGPTGVGHFRIYDRDGGPEAWTGFSEVQWVNQGGEVTDLETIQVTLPGKGAPTDITNPNAPALALPSITALEPATGPAAGATVVVIRGDNFKDRNGNTVVSGAAGVTFGGTNAAYYAVLDRYTIVAKTPAHAAGSTQTVVTNTAGASPNVAADDFLFV